MTASLDRYPAGLPLTADQITEFHAARLLLLLHLCGIKSRIEGLTKLAKLDFFVRYPAFFQRAASHLEQQRDDQPTTAATAVESAMIRHHYGPWDARYYQILAFLEGRELITVEQKKKTFIFSLTEKGADLAKQLTGKSAYKRLCGNMKDVKKLLGSKTGSALKNLVYQLFDEEVAKLPLGQVIKP